MLCANVGCLKRLTPYEVERSTAEPRTKWRFCITCRRKHSVPLRWKCNVEGCLEILQENYNRVDTLKCRPCYKKNMQIRKNKHYTNNSAFYTIRKRLLRHEHHLGQIAQEYLPNRQRSLIREKSVNPIKINLIL